MHSRKTIIFAVVTTLIAYSFAHACDRQRLNAEDSFRQADSVFIGRAISIEPNGFKYKVTFEVTRSLKGDSAKYISLHQWAIDRDFQFVQGVNYLVYAERFNDGELSASSSLNTQPYNVRACGTKVGRFSYFTSVAASPFSLDEIALITAISVSLSLSIGFGVTKLWRKRKQS